MKRGIGNRESGIGLRALSTIVAGWSRACVHTLAGAPRRNCRSALARDAGPTFNASVVGSDESRVPSPESRLLSTKPIPGLVGDGLRVSAHQQGFIRPASIAAGRSPLAPHAARRATRDRGFTLIELLVAMTLVALLMMMVYEGLRTGQRAAETGQAFIDRTNRLRITHEFVRQQVGRLMPLAYKQEGSTGKLFMFEGDGEKIRFVAPMPGYLGYGGTYVQELELIRDGRYRSLVFRHWLHNGFDEDEIDDSEPPILLLSGIRDGTFRFRGLTPEGKVGDWEERWEDSQLTPLSIQLELEMSPESRIEWPLLEVVMMVDGGATRGFNAGMLPSG